MLVYGVANLALFVITFLVIYLLVKPPIYRTKKFYAKLLFYLGVIMYGGIFPIAFDYAYSTYKPDFFGYAFILTGIYGVMMLGSAGYLWVTSAGGKDYRRKDNPFMWNLSGYGLLILIGCIAGYAILNKYVPLFEQFS